MGGRGGPKTGGKGESGRGEVLALLPRKVGYLNWRFAGGTGGPGKRDRMRRDSEPSRRD